MILFSNLHSYYFLNYPPLNTRFSAFEGRTPCLILTAIRIFVREMHVLTESLVILGVKKEDEIQFIKITQGMPHIYIVF